MPNPYTSAIKITKELEDKAKDIKQKKEQCEKLDAEIAKIIDDLKNTGIDVTEMMAKVKQGKTIYDNRNYAECIELYNDILKNIKSIELTHINNYDKDLNKIFELSNYFNIEVQKYQVEYKSILDSASERFVEATKNLENLKNKSMDALLKKLTAIITDIRNKIKIFDTAERGIFESRSDEILELLDKKETILAADKLKKLDIEFREHSGEKYRNLLSELVNLKKSVEYTKLNMDSNKIARDEKEIEEEYKNGNLEKAIEQLNKLINSLKMGINEFFENILSISFSSLEEAKYIGVENIAETENDINKIKTDFYEGNYLNSLTALKKIISQIEKLKFQKLYDEISRVKDILSKAKEDNIDITDSLNILDSAKDKLKEKDYMGTFNDVKEASSRIEKIVELRNKLLKEVAETKDQILRIQKDGILISSSEAELDNISELIKKDANKAESHLEEYKNRLRKDLEDYALTLKIKIEENIAIAKMYELNLAMFDFELLEQLFENSDFIKYINTNNRINKALVDAIEKTINAKIKDIEKNVADVSKETAQKVTEVIDNVKELLKEHSYAEINKLFKNIENILWLEKAREYAEKLSSIEEVVESLEKENFDVSDIKTKIKIFKVDIEQKNESVIKQAYSELKNTFDKLKSDIVKEVLTYIKTIFINLNKFGIEQEKTPLPGMMENIQENLKKGNLEEAFNSSLILKMQGNNILNNTESLFIQILSLKEKLKDVKKFNADTSDLDLKFIKIRDLFKKFSFEECNRLISELDSEIENAKYFSEIEKIKRRIEDIQKMTQTLAFGSEFESDTVSFKRSLNEKKYREAKELSEKIFGETINAIKSFFNEHFSNLDQQIESLKNRHMEIDLKEELLDESKRLFINKEYSKSLELLKSFENNINNVKYIYDILESDLKMFQKKVNESKNLGLDVSDIEKEYEDVERQISGGDYTTAINRLKTILSNITDRINGLINTILREARKEIKNAKSRNRDTTIPESLLSSAELNLKNGNDYEALKRGFDVLEELGKTTLQKDMAMETLKKLKYEIKNSSITLDKNIIEKQNSIEQAINLGKYSEGIDISLKLLDQIQESAYMVTEIQRNLEVTKKLITKLRALKLDTDDAIKLINEAKDRYLKVDYNESLSLIKESVFIMGKRLREHLIVKDREYDKLLSAYEKYCNFQKIAEQVKDLESIGKDKIEEFSKKRDELTLVMKADLEKIIAEKMDMIKNYALSEKRHEIYISDLTDKMSQLEKLRAELSYEHFIEKLDETLENFEKKLYDRVLEFIRKTEEKIEKYKMINIDFLDIFVMLADLSLHLEEADLEKILDEMKAIETKIDSRVSSELENVIKNKYADMEYINTREARNLKEQIKNAFQNRQYAQVINYLNDVKSVIDKYETMLKDARLKFEEIKNKFIQIKIENKETNLLLNRANEIALLINNDPELAIEKIQLLSQDIDRFILAHNEILTLTLEVLQIKENVLIAKLQIINNSSNDTKNIQINISGALSRAEKINIEQIKANEKTEMETELSINRTGNEIEFGITFTNMEKAYESNINAPFELNVDPGYEIKKATKTEKCEYCKGKIFSGLDYVACKTGDAVYHVQCAKRAKKCVICHRDFIFDNDILARLSVTT